MNRKRLWKRAAACALSLGMSMTAVFAMRSNLRVYADEVTMSGQAILVYLSESDLGTEPADDAKAMERTLQGTDQFDENDSGSIVSIDVSEKSDTDYKSSIWEAIDRAAIRTDENSLTVFFYSGHGGAEKDGTSYLACGKKNNISAEELRTHLDALHGKVLVVISACYSGGMIMPASEMDELDDLDELDQANDSANDPLQLLEDSERAFLQEFYSEAGIQAASNEEEGGAVAAGQPKYYFITAASDIETSLQQAGIGGQDVASLGHALGYDRNDPAYRVFAADTSCGDENARRDGYAGDGKITMQELEEYVKETNQISSTQTIYPSNCSDVLFTYSDSAGVPASFTCSLKEEGNASVTKDAVMTMTVSVRNLTDHALQLGIDFYTDSVYSYALTTGQQGVTPKGDFLEADKYTGMDTTWEIAAGIGEEQDLCFSMPWEPFASESSENKGGPFGIRVSDKTNGADAAGTYRLMKFYTSTSDEKDSPDPEALSLQKPVQFMNTDPENDQYCITRTSSQLPVQIRYDTKGLDKHTVAGCRLSLYVYDLGEAELPSGIHIDTATEQLLDEQGDVIFPVEEQSNTIVFEDIRPSSDRDAFDVDDIYDPKRDGIYTYIMDTSGLQEDHYYLLQVVCQYDVADANGNSSNSVYALIQRTDAAAAGQYTIPSFRLTYDTWNIFRRWDGIPAEQNWKIYYEKEESQITVSSVSTCLQGAFQEADQRYTYKVTGWEIQTRAAEQDAEAEWSAMEDTDTFAPGNTYGSTIEIMVNDANQDAVFSWGTVFTADRHEVELLSLTEDEENNKRTATIRVIHSVPVKEELDEAQVSLHPVVNGVVGECVDTSITDEENGLHAGDKVILVPEDGCVIYAGEGLKKTTDKIDWNGKSYVVYELEAPKSKDTMNAVVRVWKDDGNSCGCAVAPYWWIVHEKTESDVDDPDDAGSEDSSSDSSADSGPSGSSSSGSDSAGGSSADSGPSGSSSSGNDSAGGSSADSGSTESSSTGNGASESGSEDGGSSNSGSAVGGSKEDCSVGTGSAGSYWESIPKNNGHDGQTKTPSKAQTEGQDTANVTTIVHTVNQTAKISDINGTAQAPKPAKSTGIAASGKKAATGGGSESAENSGKISSVWETVEDSDSERKAAEKTWDANGNAQSEAVQEDDAEAAREDGTAAAALEENNSNRFLWWLVLLVAAAGGVSFVVIFLYRKS